MNQLAGKTALITEVAHGIGCAFAQAYVREGAKVMLADINLPAAKAAAEAIVQQATAVELDVTDQSSIWASVAALDAQTGGIDIFVNTSVLFDAAPIVAITRVSFDHLMAINVAGPLFMMQAVSRGMSARGCGGEIINLAGQAWPRGKSLVADYCATKAAVITWAESHFCWDQRQHTRAWRR
jgi:NAD(P)-dependent dehydrogenase (short-subunit alcohol dehydrogenase family)